MTEQQYRVIADTENGDDIRKRFMPGDRVTFGTDTEGHTVPVRIEHPLPATGLPDPMHLTDAEADSFHEAMHAPHPPTREQIVQALGRYITEGQYERVLALIQNGADR
jgi:hypothetical protein